MPKEKNNPVYKYARFSGIVIQMVVIIGVGTFSGIKMDEVYPNENNLWTISLALLGVFVALYFVIRQVTKS